MDNARFKRVLELHESSMYNAYQRLIDAENTGTLDTEQQAVVRVLKSTYQMGHDVIDVHSALVEIRGKIGQQKSDVMREALTKAGMLFNEVDLQEHTEERNCLLSVALEHGAFPPKEEKELKMREIPELKIRGYND